MLSQRALQSLESDISCKSEKMWKEWEEKFLNYLRCLLGANGVPLVYVIRENDAPNHTTNHPDFVDRRSQTGILIFLLNPMVLAGVVLYY